MLVFPSQGNILTNMLAIFFESRFTHDLLHQTLQQRIPAKNRKLLHKTIGKVLLDSKANNTTMHLLAVDHINMFCEVGSLSSDERAEYAKANAKAAKYAIAASSFEKGELVQSYLMGNIFFLELLCH